jgi:hypothetical protein
LATPDAESGAPVIAARGKNAWWEEAKAREDMRGLSERGFSRAWAKIAAEHPEISRPGAKSKPDSSRSNRITAPKKS